MRGLTSPMVRVAEYDGFERSPMKNIQNENLKEPAIAEKARNLSLRAIITLYQ